MGLQILAPEFESRRGLQPNDLDLKREKRLERLAKKAHEARAKRIAAGTRAGTGRKKKPKPKTARQISRSLWFKRRREADPAWRLNRNVRAAIWKSLRGIRPASWQQAVGYSLSELQAHLEAQFTRGMSWSNYGQWHIDHIHPLAAFTFDGPACAEFAAAWALSNLQPLWGADNLSKGARTKNGLRPAHRPAQREAARMIQAVSFVGEPSWRARCVR